MNMKISLLSFAVIAAFSFSTVLAENVSAIQSTDEVSQIETMAGSRIPLKKLIGLRDLTIQKGTSSTGGGGRSEIPAESYPDIEKLKAAIQIINEKVTSANLPEQFKNALLSEVQYLFENDKISTLPALVDFQNSLKGHRQPDNKLRFNSMSGISRKSPRETIILSWLKHQKMDALQAASNIMHEATHNILSEALTEDETFCEDLELAIMQNNLSKELLFALNEGIYVKDGVIYMDQLIDFAGKDLVLRQSASLYFYSGEKFFIDWWDKNRLPVAHVFVTETYTKTRAVYKAENVWQLSDNFGTSFVNLMSADI